MSAIIVYYNLSIKVLAILANCLYNSSYIMTAAKYSLTFPP